MKYHSKIIQKRINKKLINNNLTAVPLAINKSNQKVNMSKNNKSSSKIMLSKKEILDDYRIAHESRQASLLGRREVLTGKAKFGIFGDGKEVPQIAMAKVFKDGDWRSGYYRDQTFMLATGMITLEEVFAELYGDTDFDLNRGNGGRLMNNHFATRSLDENGKWVNLTKQPNSSADTSPTASQMPRALGLALASKIFKHDKDLASFDKLSNKGSEVTFATIGDASTSEGHFFETVNAAGVLEVPLAISIWDDGWGISVPNKYQTTKGNISDVLSGFAKDGDSNGYIILKESCNNYKGLVEIYEKGIEICRNKHPPVIFHITDCTQPQGHSTSGSHERYKSEDQLKHESEIDCLFNMKQWIIENNIATAKELDNIEKESIKRVKQARKNAWDNYLKPILLKKEELLNLVDLTNCNCAHTDEIEKIKEDLNKVGEPIYKDIISSAKKILRLICNSCSNPHNSLKINVRNWLNKEMEYFNNCYSSHLNSQSELSATNVEIIDPQYDDKPEILPGREIIRDNFDKIFASNPLVYAFGEDVGKIGGVNQTYEGLQDKYGENRIFDTGIRETTIIGQGLGMALRGLRPIAEIQYFDYLLYGLQVLSDDLATTHYRTRGRQKAPMIVSTRGHRLEGIWHAGSPLSMVINSMRGVHIAVPRNMTQAAGFYNTYLKSDQPVLIIEPLNGYRLREKKPKNIGEFNTPVGIPEIINEGSDITLVTYGSCVRIAEDAVKQLKEFNISVELIDVRSLIPFDLNRIIVESIKKTNKVLFFDEDVPGGATAYMMQIVMEEHNGYFYVDSKPQTLTAKPHRSAYSTDGDYFSNPNAEDVFDALYNIMHEYNPENYPKLF